MKKSTKKALDHFKKHDKVLFNAAKTFDFDEDLTPDQPQNYFYSLCRSVVGQQLADAAASTILSRFVMLFPGKIVTPKKVLKIPLARIRKAGLSNAKATYIKNIAKAIIKKDLHINDLPKLDDEHVLEELTKIKGVGPWTAEMFLMFVLGREDVFSRGDLGLRNAMKSLYGFKKEPSKKQVENIVSKWSPYKTYGCLILWKTIDG